MTECEDCGEKVRRRIRCFHCGLLVCSWCWGHVHRCEPGHKKENCRSYKYYKKYGMPLIKQLRKFMLSRKLCEADKILKGEKNNGSYA